MFAAVDPYIAQLKGFFGATSLDIIIVSGIVLALFLFGMWQGKIALARLFFSIPMAGFVFLIFPFTQFFGLLGHTSFQIALGRLGFFTLCLVVIYFLLSRITYSYSAHSRAGRWFDNGLLAVGSAALLLALYHNPLSLTPIYRFGPMISNYFEPSLYLFYWLLGSFIAFFIAIRR